MTPNIYSESISTIKKIAGMESYTFTGASERQIAELERYAQAELPREYVRFLRTMGQSAGPLFTGSTCTFSDPCTLRLRDEAEKILKRTSSRLTLPDQSFIFLTHHGYQFSFFPLDAGNDPPVFVYTDRTRSQFERISAQFSDFFAATVRNYLAMVREYPDAV